MTTLTLPYRDVAALVAARPATPGRHRRACDAIVGGDARGGKHKAAAGHHDGLLLDAHDAAVLLAHHCDSWTADQILAHAELANLAAAEASRSAAPGGKGQRRNFWGRKNHDPATAGDLVAELEFANAVLTQVRTAYTFTGV